MSCAIAPWVASFYGIPELAPILKVISLSLIINALSTVHKTKLTIDLDFKTQSYISIIAAVLSGAIGIYLANTGHGVWSLVYQTLINAALCTLLYIIFTKRFLRLCFSKKSFDALFAFGSKLLLSSLLAVVFRNIYSIVIGKKFSSTDLGYYTRADQFAQLPAVYITSVVMRVLYPVLASVQDDQERLVSTYRKFIRFTSIIIFPITMAMVALAKPIIVSLLTDKWIEVAPLMQILCFDWFLDHLSMINLNVLYVKGRSDLALRIEIIKKTIAIILLIITIPWGLEMVCVGRVIYSFIATYLNSYYTKKMIGLGLFEQLKDVMPYLTISLITGVAIYFAIMMFGSSIIQMIFGIIFYSIIYIALLLVFDKSSLLYLKEAVVNLKNRT